MDIVGRVTFHPDAADDLRKLAQTDRRAAARIVAFFQQAKADPRIIDSLLVHDFGTAYSGSPYHIGKWNNFWRVGSDIWILKFWKAPGSQYRVIYGYVPQTQQFHVLAVAHRNFDYRPGHPVTARVKRAYEELRGKRY
ncbi:MAG: type II toxin-antitoxin system RelE/ParE family toxin [Gammaproteobacteria bacterium]|nr:type II toxin-antitoxin system RelE/ParE family toxin [Gammaproteobacteria bacterium]